MSTITISRDYGSDGDIIAQQVAQTLGYHFVDQELIGNILGQYGYVEFDNEYRNLPTFWERFDVEREMHRDTMMTMLNQVLQALAQHGDVVILGRSGFEVLRGFTDVFHVRVQAPFTVRVQRVMALQKITFEEAEQLVKKRDKVRLAFVEEFYKVPWGSIQAFDLIVNTAKIPVDMATAWVIDGVKASISGLETDQPTTASIEVDPILADTVTNVLGCKETHQ
ncbi:MAG: AAA family ATPase [Anaerolineaceae bacterium]